MGVRETVAADGDVSRALGQLQPKQLEEISGIAASRRHVDALWLHNDGDSGILFAVDTSGSLIASVSCSAKIKDLEEIAIGPGPRPGADYLYLGDIGDNDQERRAIRIVRFAEPKLTGKRGERIEMDAPEVFRLTYPDGPHDAEAMFVDSEVGDLFIVTKEKQRARLYTIPIDRLKEDVVSTLDAAGTLDVDRVSAGGISPDGSRVILRRENQGWLWSREQGERVADALQSEPVEVPVLGKRQAGNGEAIGFSAAGHSYFTVSEGKKQTIYEFALPSSTFEGR